MKIVDEKKIHNTKIRSQNHHFQEHQGGSNMNGLELIFGWVHLYFVIKF